MKQLDFAKGAGLIPVVIQDDATGVVLMLGYMNEVAVARTQASGLVYFWSRSRNSLWLKGATSGNQLKVKTIWMDCDADTLLIKVELLGQAACHTGNYSCFSTEINRKAK